jgi:hypothetical protein
MTHDLLMPASYTLVAEEEMIYLDGGGEFLDSAIDFAASIPSLLVSFTGNLLYSIWAAAKNIVLGTLYMAIDDLLNPNFQGTVLALGVLALCSGALFPKNSSSAT